MQQGGEALVEAFLIVDQPRQRLGHWSHALSPLDDQAAPPLANVRAYWDPTTDQALINLAYDPFALGTDRLHYVVEIALLAELGMIQPAELSRGDRRRFLEERLARCSLRVDNQRNVVGALVELVKMIRELKSGSGRIPLPRGDTQDPVMLVKARGTRDNLPRSTIPMPAPLRDRPEASPLPTRKVPEVAPRTTGHVVRNYHRAPTVQMPPDEIERRASESATPNEIAPGESLRMPIASGMPRSETNVATDRMPTAPIPQRAMTDNALTDKTPAPQPKQPNIIYARYLRSGRWVPIRVGALSLKGAALMAGALPRIDDHVDVALSFGAHRALVRGNVGKISSVEEVTASGASSFNVSFQLDEVSRRQLTALLTAARAAKITIKPAPPRTARRFPVDWLFALQTSKGIVRSEALDVSRDGMFVHPQHALTLGTSANFSTVLDDGGAAVSGRAKIVRYITEAEARSCGLAAGYGLCITEMGPNERTRWLAFLDRIERRSERRVLIGAPPHRLPELQADLAAVGYAVTSATDPGALVQLAGGDVRPVDAALIDAGWLSPSASREWVESLLARNIPCVQLHGDAKRARTLVDQLLIFA
ncbi:MAG: PilZ domain-containing protein [Kofleriaceae bacterium]